MPDEGVRLQVLPRTLEKWRLEAAKLGLPVERYLELKTAGGDADAAVMRGQAAVGGGGSGSGVDDVAKVAASAQALSLSRAAMREFETGGGSGQKSEVSELRAEIRAMEERHQKEMKELVEKQEREREKDELKKAMEGLGARIDALSTGGGAGKASEIAVLKEELAKRDAELREILTKQERDRESSRIEAQLAKRDEQAASRERTLSDQVRGLTERIEDLRNNPPAPAEPPRPRDPRQMTIAEAEATRDGLAQVGLVIPKTEEETIRGLRTKAAEKKIDREDKLLTTALGEGRYIAHMFFNMLADDVVKAKMRAQGYPVDQVAAARTPEETDAAWKAMAAKMQQLEQQLEQQQEQLRTKAQGAAPPAGPDSGEQ